MSLTPRASARLGYLGSLPFPPPLYNTGSFVLFVVSAVLLRSFRLGLDLVFSYTSFYYGCDEEMGSTTLPTRDSALACLSLSSFCFFVLMVILFSQSELSLVCRSVLATLSLTVCD